MKKLILFIILLSILNLPGISLAKILHVKTDGSDSNSGLSWAEAVGSIQNAIDKAVSNDDIWVAGGTYGLSSQIEIDKAVAIYGGFEGWEGEINQRSKPPNSTIVKAQEEGR